MVDFGQLKFLLVEDDQVDVKNVKRAFKKNNITNPLYIAGNGEEALEMLRGSKDGEPEIPSPHIILLDLNMPKMNGIEFLQELRKDPKLKPISVYILSTSDEEKDILKAYNLNVAGYILKPLDFTKFIKTISTLDSFWKLCQFPKEIKPE
ncbi:MAG: response regulator [Candidatus Nitronauta litoralis]|uniref:Response regulator n=1 Tax=Candidatus Nitronauta litoralis TaxID=2705533 RepID=A0A7T0FZ31_9BACT|nr:MAG: response regulator [Candidatus Nitronauta litoralis]